MNIRNRGRMAEISQIRGFGNAAPALRQHQKRFLKGEHPLCIFEMSNDISLQLSQNLVGPSENRFPCSETQTGLSFIKKPENIHPSHWCFCLIGALLFSSTATKQSALPQ